MAWVSMSGLLGHGYWLGYQPLLRENTELWNDFIIYPFYEVIFDCMI